VLAALYVSALLFNGIEHYQVLLLVLALPAAVLAGSSTRAGVILVAGSPALDSYAIIATEPQVVTVFQVVLVSALMGALWRLTRARKPRVARITIWDVGIVLFLAAAAVSVPLSVDVRGSVIGTIEIAALTGMYLFLSRAVREAAVWSDVFYAVVLTSGASALVAIGQAFLAHPPVPLLEHHLTGSPVVAERVSGYFANPNSLALMLLLGVILLAEAIIRDDSVARRIGFAVLGLICVIALAFTFSREAIVGLVVGGVALLLMSALTARARSWSLAALAVVFVAVLAFPGVHERAASVLDIRSDPSAMDRVYLSEVSLRMFADHPLTGIGMSSFMAAYPRYADPRVTIDPVPNGHQMPFSIPAETGVLGLLAELLMVGALVLGVRAAPRLAKAGMRIAGVAAAIAFFAMSFANGFWFCEAFWTTLALVGAVFRTAPLGPALLLEGGSVRVGRVDDARLSRGDR